MKRIRNFVKNFQSTNLKSIPTHFKPILLFERFEKGCSKQRSKWPFVWRQNNFPTSVIFRMHQAQHIQQCFNCQAIQAKTKKRLSKKFQQTGAAGKHQFVYICATNHKARKLDKAKYPTHDSSSV